MSAPLTEPTKEQRACRWCGVKARYQPVAGFCSRMCAHEFYGTTESDRDE